MPTAPGDDAAPAPHDENAAYRAMVSELIGLGEHVQSSLRPIEQMIDRKTPTRDPEGSTNIIVLDDVSPRYMRAVAALQSCDVSLGLALRFLLDPCESRAQAASPPLLFGNRGANRRVPGPLQRPMFLHSNFS
jgi:hypothetical protein